MAGATRDCVSWQTRTKCQPLDVSHGNGRVPIATATGAASVTVSALGFRAEERRGRTSCAMRLPAVAYGLALSDCLAVEVLLLHAGSLVRSCVQIEGSAVPADLRCEARSMAVVMPEQQHCRWPRLGSL